jgi:hypothetical protein
MAVLTANLGLVFGSLSLNGCGLLGVAMDALSIGQRRNLCRSRLHLNTKYHKRHNNYAQTAVKSDSSFSA